MKPLLVLFLACCHQAAAVDPPAIAVVLAVTQAGAGTIVVTPASESVDCMSATCNYTFRSGTSVTLSPTPEANAVFSAWGGDCSGNGVCQLTMAANRAVTGSFAAAPRRLTVNTSGAGTGRVTPAGGDFPHGQTVSLVATADAGFFFAGWQGGGCSGVGTCMVTMTAATTVTAVFVPVLFYSNRPKPGSSTGGAYNPWSVKSDGSDPRLIFDVTTNSMADPAWSPDGTRVIMASDVPCAGGTKNNIWTVRYDGTDARCLTQLQQAVAQQPVWSPTGDRVAFASNLNLDGNDASPTGAYNVWVMAADGSNRQPLTRMTNAAIKTDLQGGTWRGSRIAFMSARGLQDANLAASGDNIWVVDVMTGTQTAVTQDGHASEHPSLSPDGTRIAYLSRAAPSGGSGVVFASNIWVSELGNQSRRSLTGNQNVSFQPPVAWSVDGATLFSSSRAASPSQLDVDSGVERLYKVTVASSVVAFAAAASGVRGFASTPSPDGRWLLFSSDADNGVYNVWKAPLDGSALPVSVTASTGSEQSLVPFPWD